MAGVLSVEERANIKKGVLLLNCKDGGEGTRP